MVIPDEIKQQILYHYPNAKLKICYGLYYSDELNKMSKKQFFYGIFEKEGSPHFRILHSDKTIRTIRGRDLHETIPLLVESVLYNSGTIWCLGYLIEIT